MQKFYFIQPDQISVGLCFQHRLQLVLAALILTVFVVLNYSNALAETNDRVLRVLIDKNKPYPILGINAVAEHGYRTSIKIADCPPFDDDVFKGALRFEIEMALLCEAFTTADIADRLDFYPYPNIKRAVADIAAGRADIIGTTMFKAEADGDVLRSEPTLRLGEFQVALFTTPSRRQIKNISTVKELRELRGITVKHWMLDLKTLEGMGLKSIVKANNLTQIPKMIDRGRADFTLSYLDRATTDHMGGPLVRIDGFRASFQDERVFVVAKQRPEILKTINEFLSDSRNQPEDRVRAAHLKIGFISDKYDHWLEVGVSD